MAYGNGTFAWNWRNGILCLDARRYKWFHTGWIRSMVGV